MLRSVVEYYAEHESYKCGYCRSPNTNFSHGMWAHTMTVSDYQDLIDRGWRRSGKYCYKPTMDVTCCPMYTIRCHVLNFKATKSQKKVMKQMNKFMTVKDTSEQHVGDCERKMSTCSSGPEAADETNSDGREQFVETTRKHQDINLHDIVSSEFEAPNSDDTVGPSDGTPPNMDISRADSVADINKQKTIKKGTGPDPTKTPCKKAKQQRHERKLEKLKEKGIDAATLNNSDKNKEKQIEDFINDLPTEIKQRLEIKLVRTTPPSPEWLATSKETHIVYVKYQMIIHGDKPEKCSESKFKEFLVHSPLLEEHSETSPPCGYGSFHQQYCLDGKIIAVGVIDILPKCVSSVYFFYDPQYMNLTLGTYGALREIAFTRHLTTLSSTLKYYYMGYYVHSCQKMRYKGRFYPSDLLCPETYNWFPLKDCVPRLEASPYSRLDPNIDNLDLNLPSSNDLNYIPVLVKGVVLPYKKFLRNISHKKGRESNNSDDIMEFARLVGAKSAKSLILVR